MAPNFFNSNVDDAFDLLIETTIGRADDLYYLDGETAFRSRGGTVETFDAELAYTGGQQ
jgi:hypothetical protein